MPATLTPTIILQRVIQQVRVEAPMLSYFAGGFTNQRVRLGQTAIAHIVSSPTPEVIDVSDPASDRNLMGGDDTKDLLSDVQITLDKEVRVTLSLTRVNALQDNKQALSEIFSNAAAAVAKGIVDNILSKVTAANFTNVTTETAVNTDIDTLAAIRAAMNGRGVGKQRFGLINSDVANALGTDTRIGSNDYEGQRLGGDPYARFQNIQGCREIAEYPDFPGNSQNLSGFFFEKSGIQYVTTIPDDSGKTAEDLGIPKVLKYDQVRDPATGLTLQSVMGMDQNTEEIFMVIRLLVGSKLGGTELGARGQRLRTSA
jgi:hypothetical protein